jgi:hypothetical protein
MKRASLVLALLMLAACDRSPDTLFPNSASPTEQPSFPSVTANPGTSPTPPALPEVPPPTSGPATASCVDGWSTPAEGSALAARPLRVLRRTVRFRGEPVVVDLRYFTGPESPPSDKGYLLTVQRWYVKLFASDDPAFQGRFLVEAREFGEGVVAVAAYDTEGFRSPDWSGFQWDGGDRRRRAYPGLPGRWAGIRYDFVRGGAGLRVPGLPPQVRGCLDTT